MAAISYNILLATPGSVSKQKDFFLDGNYTKAQPCGAPVPTYPFLNQGDTQTVVFRQKYDQALASYAPLDLTKAMPGVAGAYPFGDVNFRDGGCGIWEFERTYGNIPRQRIRVGQSHTYAFQYVLSSGAKMQVDPDAGTFSYDGPTYTLGTEPMKVDSTLIIDYFLAGKESTFPLLEAPKAIQVGQSVQCRGVDYKGGPFPLRLVGSEVIGITPGSTILAEDDNYDEFMGAIRCRVRRIINAPTPGFWQNNFH